MTELIYGRQPVLAALRAGKRTFERLMVRRGVDQAAVAEILRMAEKLRIPIHWEEEAVFRKMVGEVAHQGVILVASSFPFRSWEALLREVAGDPQALLGFVDRVEDPRNLGAIIRTAAFFGFRGLVVSKARTAPLASQAVKASCGGVEFLNLVQVNNFLGVIRAFKEKGVFLVGMEADAPLSLWELEVGALPVGLVVGGEHQGIRKLLRSECDFLVKVPALGAVTSLNVSVAFGIGAYELIRQKRGVREGEKG